MKADRENGKANRIQWLWGVALLALVACGGGSSGGDDTPPPQDPPPPSDEDPGDDDDDGSDDDTDDSGDDNSDDDDANDDGSNDDDSSDDDSGNDDDGSSDDGSDDDGSNDDDSSDDDSGNDDDGSNDDGSDDDNSDTDDPPENQAPTASAGEDQTVYETDAVTLPAEASDSDGEVVSYEWNQEAGDNVSFDGSETTDTLSFTAPTVSDEHLELTFSVTVTDDDGETASDTVQVMVLAEEAPSLTLDFPTPEAIDEDGLQDIAVYGRVQAQGDIELDRVVVDAGAGEREATVTDGRWRVDDLPLPPPPSNDDMTIETIEVTVTNMEGHSNTVESQLYRNEIPLGDGPIWGESPGLALGPDGDRFYLLAYGGEPDIKLMEVDRETGDRTATITDFTDSAQGPTFPYKVFTDLVFDADNDRFFLTASPGGGDKQVVVVDRDTGQRSIYSGPDQGEGPALNNPQDLYLDDEGQLWVSDNSNGDDDDPSGVFRIELNGDRERRFEQLYLLSGLLDASNDRFLTVPLTSYNPEVKAWDLSVDPPTDSSLSTGTPSLEYGADSLHLDAANNRLLLRVRGTDALVAISLTDGAREQLATGLLGMVAPPTPPKEFNATESAYDPERRVFYAAGGENRDGLVAVDPQSGDRVVISR